MKNIDLMGRGILMLMTMTLFLLLMTWQTGLLAIYGWMALLMLETVCASIYGHLRKELDPFHEDREHSNFWSNLELLAATPIVITLDLILISFSTGEHSLLHPSLVLLSFTLACGVLYRIVGILTLRYLNKNEWPEKLAYRGAERMVELYCLRYEANIKVLSSNCSAAEYKRRRQTAIQTLYRLQRYENHFDFELIKPGQQPRRFFVQLFKKSFDFFGKPDPRVLPHALILLCFADKLSLSNNIIAVVTELDFPREARYKLCRSFDFNDREISEPETEDPTEKPKILKKRPQPA